LDENVHRIKNR